MSYDIKRSVSLYSYQQEYYEGRLDLEGCIREAAKAGATGIELLGEQMIDEFPVITPEFKAKWFGWMEKYNVEPTCYDAFLENHIYQNRTCTLREQVAMMERDIKIAAELGFKTLRTLVATPMDVIEGSLEIAKKHDVKICIEVHAPFSLNSGWSDGYLEMIKRTGTKHFGFMPDFGIFCKEIPHEARAQALRFGATEKGVNMVDEHYKQRVAKGFTKIKYDLNLGRAFKEYITANGLFELIDSLKAAGCNEHDIKYANGSFTYSWSEPQDIIDNIEYIYHTHAKSYGLTEDYIEPCIPLNEVIAAYKKAGYVGFLSTEYEGQKLINDSSEVDSVEQVRRQLEAMRIAIEEME